MTSKLVVLRVLMTELPMLVEQKSKQTALNDTPELMSLPINDLSYLTTKLSATYLTYTRIKTAQLTKDLDKRLEVIYESVEELKSKVNVSCVSPKLQGYLKVFRHLKCDICG